VKPEKLEEYLGRGSLFFGKVRFVPQVDSTNTRLKALAEAGAPEGTVLLAAEQTGGRGTGGRSFFSPEGGLYVSVLLRPRQAAPEELFTLTGRAAVAVREGIAKASGAPCRIKWLNDICLNGRKLCGILTELSPLTEMGADYVVLGVGINVSQREADFARAGLGEIATSLAAEGYAVTMEGLAAAVLEELEKMYRLFPAGRQEALERYRGSCLTLGRRVCWQAEGGTRQGLAADIGDRFELLADGPEGRELVMAGTVRLLEEREGET